jgi:hypothetical protein
VLLSTMQRYRALFALRNKGGEEAVAVLGEAFSTSSALLKHEVAYVMGQMQHPASAGVLGQVLQVRQAVSMLLSLQLCFASCCAVRFMCVVDIWHLKLSVTAVRWQVDSSRLSM